MSVDCLAHFNLTKLIKLLEDISAKSARPKVVELVNFDCYNILLDQGGAQMSKSVRDL